MNVRPIRPDDFPALAAWLAEDETHLFGRSSRVGVPDVTAWLSGPDLASDTWLFEEDGMLVALGWVEKHDDVGVAIGVVHRERRGRGLGSKLVDRSEERLRALGVGRIHAIALAPDVAAQPLLAGRGYREVRRFWEMTIALDDDPPPEPRLPEGFRIEPFSSDLAHAFHGALEEAFAEHWEHQPESFEEWWQRQLGKPDHDPSLWFQVRIDEDIVAATWRRLGERNRCDEALREHRHGRRDGERRLGEGARMNIRPFVDNDASTVAALTSGEEERLYGRPGRVTGADILMYLQWSKEAWVWEDDRRMVASASFGVHAGAANIRGVVADKGRGLGTEILERGAAFARAEGAKKIMTGAPEPDAAARALFESHGYREVRRFYEMAIELTEAPSAPVVPAGFVVDELRDDEYEAFYNVLNEAFAEHWEWHPKPFDEWLELRQGQHRDEQGPVWFVVREGNELAAVTRNDADVAGGGYVGAIGVRPAWRGKGLAKALLQRTFAEFWRRGTTRVTLDVDSQNETGAVRLYEQVGMAVEACGVAFEKELA